MVCTSMFGYTLAKAHGRRAGRASGRAARGTCRTPTPRRSNGDRALRLTSGIVSWRRGSRSPSSTYRSWDPEHAGEPLEAVERRDRRLGTAGQRDHVAGDPNGDGDIYNDRLPGYARNAFMGPDYLSTDLRIIAHHTLRRARGVEPGRGIVQRLQPNQRPRADQR
jgi:hypothetical protein